MKILNKYDLKGSLVDRFNNKKLDGNEEKYIKLFKKPKLNFMNEG